MNHLKSTPILARLTCVYEMGLVLSVAWLLLFMCTGNVAQAAEPLLTYETAAPGADPSWVIVYSDGQVERDLAPYMKQAGRQVGQLDPRLMSAVQDVVESLLDQAPAAAGHAADHAGHRADMDMGEITLSVMSGGEYRTVTWHPVPGEEGNVVPAEVDATLASLVYADLI